MRAITLPLRFGRRNPAPATTAPVTLSQQKVYILPSKLGALFCVTLALMLLGSINYALSLGYILTFLLAGLGVTGMLHAWRNLTGIEVRPGRREPAFAGQRTRFYLVLRNPSTFPRHAIGLRRGHEPAQFANVPAGDEAETFVEMTPAQRGWLDPGRIEIATSFPIGLFRAWSYVRFDPRILVYPAPEPDAPPIPPGDHATGNGLHVTGGDDDFAGLREYRHGDSLRRISWKATARRDAPVVKEFSGGSGAVEVWLDWAACPAELGLERRLSRMTSWTLEADAAGMRYGLRLPGLTIAPEQGRDHRDRCLTALALHAA